MVEASRGDAADQLFDAGSDLRPAVGFGVASTGRTHATRAIGVRKQLDRRASDRFVIGRIDEDPSLTVNHRVDHSSDIPADRREAVGASLEVHDSETLATDPPSGTRLGMQNT